MMITGERKVRQKIIFFLPETCLQWEKKRIILRTVVVVVIAVVVAIIAVAVVTAVGGFVGAVAVNVVFII